MIPVKGHPDLYRDENTGAILNCDDTSYQNYIQNKNLKQAQKLVEKNEIEQLKKDVTEIKSLLMELINESRRH
jgi:hypothetical protein